MSTDPTEGIRDDMVHKINAEIPVDATEASERARLEARYGQVWSTEEVRREFKVVSFLAPYVVVERLSDGAKGSLEFQHDPRFYFNWRE